VFKGSSIQPVSSGWPTVRRQRVRGAHQASPPRHRRALSLGLHVGFAGTLPFRSYCPMNVTSDQPDAAYGYTSSHHFVSIVKIFHLRPATPSRMLLDMKAASPESLLPSGLALSHGRQESQLLSSFAIACLVSLLTFSRRYQQGGPGKRAAER